MKALITGKTKLAGAIISEFHEEQIMDEVIEFESCRVGENIPWKHYDVFINNACVGFSQAELLNDVFHEWRDDPNKLIINISSRAAKPNLSQGYLYSSQKAALNHLADNLVNNSDRRCGIVTLNLGLIEHDEVPSLTYEQITNMIGVIMVEWFTGGVYMSEVTIQDRDYYRENQQFKSDLKSIEEDYYEFTH